VGKTGEAGFLYDASFGFTDDIGFMRTDSIHSFWRPTILRDASCHHGWLCCQEKEFFASAKGNRLAQDKGACLVLNWHQEGLMKRIPRLDGSACD
jgi:hypothetical protein